MKIQTRITALLIILALVFVGGLFILRNFERSRLELLQMDQKQARITMFGQVLQMRSAALEGMAKDYSLWDEMVNFVSTGDKEWAKSNVDGGLENFKANAFWVYDLENKLIHALDAHDGPAFGEIPVAPYKVSEIFAGQPFVKFFMNTNIGLMEVHGATINNVADPKREQPKGYILVGRLWDQKVIDSIEKASEVRIKIAGKDTPLPAPEYNKDKAGEIFFTQILEGIDKKEVARLDVSFHSDAVVRAGRVSKRYFFFVLIFLVAGLVIVSLSLVLWISLPLRKISSALSEENVQNIHSIEKNQSEMGDIARLIKRFFEQKEERRKDEIRIKRQALESRLLYEVTKMASQTASVTEALRNGINTICQITRWPIGHVYVLTEGSVKELRSSKIWFIQEEDASISDFKEISEKITFAKGVGLPGRIWESGEPAWIPNVQKDDNFPRRNLCKTLNIKGVFGFPIKVHNEVAAVVEIFIDEEMAIDENLLNTVRSVGEQLGRVIERKRAGEEIESARAQLLQSEKLASIGQLAAGVAHEINNPVGFISNNMEILEQYIADYIKVLKLADDLKKSVTEGDAQKAASIAQEMSKLEEEVQMDYIMQDSNKLLQHNHNGLERIRKIVLDLRIYAREEADVTALVRIEEVLDSSLNMVYNELKYKVELKKSYTDTPLIQCNAQRIGQVFINLFLNAAQAIKEKGTIEIKTYVHGKYVCVDVIDSGKGIPPEDLTKIFDPFFTTKPVGQGTGLGLSVSHEFVKKHGGEIEVQSKVEAGTTFTVKLPVV